MAFFSLLAAAAPSIITGVMDFSSGTSRIDSGTKTMASSLRSAGNSSKSAANFNIAVDQINTNKQLEGLARSVRRLSSTQRAQAASTGFDIASQSRLAIFNETLNTAERSVLEIKNAAENRQQVIGFQAEQQNVAFENQARNAEFQGDIQKFEQRKGLGANVGRVATSLLGGLF